MNSSALRSDWLATFAVFAEHLNFTRAARALALSQPAVHVQITRLAEELGVPLYVRRGRALELTAEGVELLAFTREAREHAARFAARFDARNRGEESVALASGEGAYLYLLGDALRTFARRSKARLRLRTGDRSATVAAVLAGEVHLGVAALDQAPDGITVEPFAELGQVVLVPKGHRIAAKRAAQLSDLEGEALVVPPEGRPHRTMLASALRNAGVAWSVAAEATGWALITHFASLGLGLAVVNAFCRVPSGLVARPMRGLPSVSYSLLAREGAVPGGAVALLRSLILRSPAHA